MQIAERAETRGESINRYIVETLSADVERDRVNGTQEILQSISRIVENFRAQVNSYLVAQPITRGVYEHRYSRPC